eukprot:TRINITY_DN17646_c0_g1_i4.p1 TRINITY_DN17646_c0_g1~~TRINITY_DN17646_c0_g1_i4.p1  ORF type:complete len:345 (-),score=89.93 TRINITY_DN17646_c0_g1_i4:90-1124(-)
MVLCAFCALGACFKAVDKKVDSYTAPGEDDEDGKPRGCCCVRAVQETVDTLFPVGPVPTAVLQEVKSIMESTEQMLNYLGEDTDQQKRDRFFWANMDDFEKSQTKVNTLIGQARQNAQTIVECKMPRTKQISLQDSRKGLEARQSWKTLIPELDTAFQKLHQVHETTAADAKSGWANGQKGGLTPKKLSLRQKTVDLIRDQIETIKQMVDGTLKQRVRSLEDKADKCADTLRQLGGLPDLDPASYEHYSKYLAKDLEIESYFDSIYEQNVELERKGEIVLENSIRNNEAFELLAERIDEVTLVAEKAVGMADKVHNWLKARGNGLVCIYPVSYTHLTLPTKRIV